MTHRLKELDHISFLGVAINDDLYFEDHWKAIAHKVSKKISLLKEISHHAVIKLALLYSVNIWTSTCKDNLNNIFRLHKRAARIILDTNPPSRSLPLFNTLNWLPFYQDAYVNRCMLILKRTFGKVPEYLKSMLRLNFYFYFISFAFMIPKKL